MIEFLIILICTIIFYYNRKKIRIFLKKKIKTVDIENVHEIFKPIKISENLLGPSENLIIQSFSVPSSYKVVGMTSDYESWILCCLSKVSDNIFEFGTCSGKNTMLMALNSKENSSIVSLTLNQNQTKKLSLDKKDNRISIRNIVNESNYEEFLFSGKKIEKKKSKLFF